MQSDFFLIEMTAEITRVGFFPTAGQSAVLYGVLYKRLAVEMP
jgi:hypothetical protein